jgi:catechol 2,3-dioxygenase-like lactoylglutathione lyase family enzyme
MALELLGFAPLVQVFDMPRSVAFYRDILGFEVVAQSEPGDNFDWGMLRRDGMVIMLNTAYERARRPDLPDPLRVAAHDDTALFFDCADPDAAYTYLCDRGVKAQAPVTTHYGIRQVYVSDPDGYSLCFQSPAA